jgi:hypothetical protein
MRKILTTFDDQNPESPSEAAVKKAVAAGLDVRLARLDGGPEIAQYFRGFDLAHWWTCDYRLKLINGSDFQILAIHFPKIFVLRQHIWGPIPPARYEMPEFGAFVFQMEFPRIRFNLSGLCRVTTRSWMAWHEGRGE